MRTDLVFITLPTIIDGTEVSETKVTISVKSISSVEEIEGGCIVILDNGYDYRTTMTRLEVLGLISDTVEKLIGQAVTKQKQLIEDKLKSTKLLMTSKILDALIVRFYDEDLDFKQIDELVHKANTAVDLVLTRNNMKG